MDQGLRDPNLPLAVPVDPRQALWDGADPDLITYARGPLRDKLLQRPAEIAEQIATLPPAARPAWTRPFGTPPKPGTEERTEWDTTVGQVAAYREHHNIRTEKPLGDEPARVAARGTWQHLTDTATTLAAAQRRQKEAEERARAAQARAAEQTRIHNQQRLNPPPGPGRPGGPRIGM